MPLALKFASMLLQNLPNLIEAGVRVTDIISHGNDTLKRAQDEGRDISAAEWDELNARIKVLREELHKD